MITVDVSDVEEYFSRKELLEFAKEGRAQEIIEMMEESNQPSAMILERLEKRLTISQEKAQEYFNKYANKQ